MTIQVVDLTYLGIVMAADGAISFDKPVRDRRAEDWRRRKLFRLPGLRAGIGYFGLAQVGGKPMETWLEKFIHTNADVKSGEGFALRLANSLPGALSKIEAQHRLGFHLGCYGSSLQDNIPEMHFIRNYEGDNFLANRAFKVTEELSEKNFKEFTDKDLSQSIFFQNGYHQIYNAFSLPIVNAFYGSVWPDPGFIEAPKTVRGWARMTEFRMRVVRLVFEKFHKDQGQQPVGGRLSFLTIPSNPSTPIEEWNIG